MTSHAVVFCCWQLRKRHKNWTSVTFSRSFLFCDNFSGNCVIGGLDVFKHMNLDDDFPVVKQHARAAAKLYFILYLKFKPIFFLINLTLITGDVMNETFSRRYPVSTQKLVQSKSNWLNPPWSRIEARSGLSLRLLLRIFVQKIFSTNIKLEKI